MRGAQTPIWLGIAVLLLSGCRSIDLNNNSIGSSEKPVDARSEIESTFSKSELLFSSARKFEKAGQIEEAIKLYEKAASASMKNESKVVEANRHLAVLYDLSDQPNKARQSFEVAIRSGNSNAELLNDYGYFLLKQQELAKAIKLLDVAHRKFPKNQRITTNLAMAFVSSGQVEDGYSLFESVVGKDDAASNVGAVLLQMGKAEEGKAWLQKAATTKNSKASQILQAANRTTSVR